MERKEEPAKLNRTRLRKMMDSDRSFERFSAEEKERVLRRMDSAIFMDLRNDVAFRYCFSDKNSLICLLNDILGTDITDLEFLPTQVIGPNIEGKKPIMDVYCRTSSGDFICEMQNRNSSDFYDRMLYYGCSAITADLPEGMRYMFCPVRVVAFTDFLGRHPGTVPEGQVTFTYKLREDRDSDDVFSGSLSVTLCELPRLRAQALKEAKSPAEEWFVLFNNMHRFNEKPEGLPERLAPVLERARFINTDDDMITQYMQSALTKDQIDNYTEPAYKQGVEDGTARGFVQGKTEGIIEGMAKGNRKARLAVAAQMMKDGVPEDFITKYSGLELKDLESLQENSR